MTKWQEGLKKRALNGDQEADDILWETRDMDDAQLAQYLAQNDEKVRSVLKMKSLADKDGDPALTKEYYEMLNKGIMAGQGEGRFDPNGNKLKTVDDYMQLMGVRPRDGGYTDDERAAFTNPESPSYFGKIPQDKLQLAAISQGFDNPEFLLEDMRRVGDMWQRGNQIEGYGPNNEIQPLDWALSALKGFTLPRVKEAQKEGREVTWQDISGDMVELGLNFVPGVGVVSKTGKVVAALPKVPGAIAKTAAYGADVLAVPFGSQAYDVAANRIGERDVPRSEFDWERMAAQAALMGTGKAAAKQGIRAGKDIMEGSRGAQAGGAEFKAGKDFLENIGEKTDDLIARRQAMLDRKADLARQRKNVQLEGDVDIPSGDATPDDLINADNYRILKEEAERIAKSQPEREAYRSMTASEAANRDIRKEMEDLNAEVVEISQARDEAFNAMDFQKASLLELRLDAVNKRYEELMKELFNGESPRGKTSLNKPSEAAGDAVFDAYRATNEANPVMADKFASDLVQLPDGRFMYAQRMEDNLGRPLNTGLFTHEGTPFGKTTFDPAQYKVQFPDADYTFQAPAGTKPVAFRYQEDGKNPEGWVNRNQAAREQIMKDPLLSRKLEGAGNYRSEVARDVAASVLFTGAAHNELFGQLGGLEKKRADAWWNNQMRRLSKFTSGQNFSPKQRRDNFEAIMDVMSYGLDNIPEDKFKKRPEVYRAIAKELGAPDWKHFSENEVPDYPTTSYSSAN